MHGLKRGAALVVSLAIAVGFPGRVVAIEGGESVRGAPPTDEERTAIAFRETFGFPADLALVRSAAASAEYSAVPYGVPLSLSERLELVRRVHVEIDSREAKAFGRAQPNWGGFYYDQGDRGVPVFLFTDALDVMAARIGELLPTGTRFRVEQVDRSLSELSRTQGAIVDAMFELRADGIPVTGVGLDIRANQVRVSVDGLSDDFARRIVDRFGPFITFQDSPAAHADACPSNDCRPIKGGIRMVGGAGTSHGPCTSGFLVRQTGSSTNLAVLTAGHCIWYQHEMTPYGQPWYHKTSPTGTNKVFGTSLYHTYWDMSIGDVGLIKLDSDEVADILDHNAAHKIYADPIGLVTLHSVIGTVADVDQDLNGQVCMYGQQSHTAKCGVITDSNEMKLSTVVAPWATFNYRIQNTKVYNINPIGGDSGGPVFKLLDQNGTSILAMGTHVHSPDGNSQILSGAGQSGWYTPWMTGRAAYNSVSPGSDSYNICVDSNC